jgi:hypothetical protein
MAAAYKQVFQSHPASASASVSMSDIINKENTEFFFVNVESNRVYDDDSLDTFQKICQKIINDKEITQTTGIVGEKLYVFNTVTEMVASYNMNNEVILMLVGKNRLVNQKHKFTKFTFKKDDRNPAYMPTYTVHYVPIPLLPFRPHRTKSKSGSKLKKVKKVKKDKKDKSKSVKRSRKPHRQ